MFLITEKASTTGLLLNKSKVEEIPHYFQGSTLKFIYMNGDINDEFIKKIL